MTTDHGLGSRSKDVVWYDPPITAVNPQVRNLLENYSHYAPDDVVPRVVEMRDRIWAIFPWPCIGQFRFLDLFLSRHEAYVEILARVRRPGGRLLDVGCCMAPDLRKLVHDGARPENLYGLEPQGAFMRLATEFFRDADRLSPDHFVEADLLQRGNRLVCALGGTVEVVLLRMVLHIWDREQQVASCKRVVELLKPEAGVMVVGESVGRVNGSAVTRLGMRVFEHNVETFVDLWEEVGRATGTKWDIDASLDEGSSAVGETVQQLDPGARRLVFLVRRL